jgi:GNAT superfamily N-acetyltransferase
VKKGGALVALCHVFARPALDKPPEAIVQALVVDQACRGEGVGRIMMAAAERWGGTVASRPLPLHPMAVGWQLTRFKVLRIPAHCQFHFVQKVT